jgi:hypothetical protein
LIALSLGFTLSSPAASTVYEITGSFEATPKNEQWLPQDEAFVATFVHEELKARELASAKRKIKTDLSVTEITGTFE